jgi:exodeoxyribonuclease-3
MTHDPLIYAKLPFIQPVPFSGVRTSAGFVDAYRLHHSQSGRYTWWDYRAGNFHKHFGMRIDHLLVTAPLKHRVV